jgi:hypothetical protein
MVLAIGAVVVRWGDAGTGRVKKPREQHYLATRDSALLTALLDFTWSIERDMVTKI